MCYDCRLISQSVNVPEKTQQQTLGVNSNMEFSFDDDCEEELVTGKSRDG